MQEWRPGGNVIATPTVVGWWQIHLVAVVTRLDYIDRAAMVSVGRRRCGHMMKDSTAGDCLRVRPWLATRGYEEMSYSCSGRIYKDGTLEGDMMSRQK